MSVFPTHFYVDIFSVTKGVIISQLVFRFLSEGIDPCEDVYLVHPREEVKSGASYSDITSLIMLNISGLNSPI